MKDKINASVILNWKKILDKVDRYSKGKKKYRLLFKYINWALSSDCKQVDLLFEKRKGQVQNKKIPSLFWVMWWQGLDKAPDIIKLNINRLKLMFGNDKVKVITQDNYKKYTNISETLVEKMECGDILLPTWSDIIRFNILNNYGGYWIDSTVVLTTRFKDYFLSMSQQPFFSLSNTNSNYKNITMSRWMLWFIGGVPHLNLFEYLDLFYQEYFSNHNRSIDYFLTDDVINYYYHKYPELKLYCNNLKETWYPYYLVEHFYDNYTFNVSDKVNTQLEYSVQKLTYKFSKDEIYKDSIGWKVVKKYNSIFK